jgi:hypothetical protein
MATKRVKKKSSTAPKKAAPKKAASKKAAPKRTVDFVKKPKRPAKANKPPAVPHEKTIDMTVKPPPPKPKATISRSKAVALANTFLKENVGKAELYAPRASRFRLGSIVDRGGTINICFCHEADDFDPAIVTLGAKCLESLVAAHPQLKAFEIEVQTIRM